MDRPSGVNEIRGYDELNQLISIENEELGNTTYQYDDNGNKTHETFSGVMANWSWQTATPESDGYDEKDDFIYFIRPGQSQNLSFARSSIGRKNEGQAADRQVRRR